MTKDAKITAPVLPAGPSALSGWTRTLVRALRARGLDGEALARAAGVDVARLEHPQARVPIVANTDLWRRATQATGDPSFGLYASRFVTYATFPALGAAVLASRTLREAFERVARYGRLIGDAAAARLEDDGRCVRLVLDVVPGVPLADEAVDALLSLQLRAARLVSERRELNPVLVQLGRSEPSPSEPFRRFFRAPIAFGSACNALAFAPRDIDARLPNGDAELGRRVAEVLARAVAALDDRDIVSRVRGELIGRFATGPPAQDEVAARLGMSARTLQRRLLGAGSSFQTLVAESRLRLARAYLAEGRAVTEVAFMLGFSSPSSLSRAFRRWTGRAPSDAVERPARVGPKSPR